LALHRLALRHAASALGIPSDAETVIRFTAHGSGALLFLDDMEPKISEPFLLLAAHADSDWSFDIKASRSGGLQAVAGRVLNRALSEFRSGQATLHVKSSALREFLPVETT
jgi:hypothetical protein